MARRSFASPDANDLDPASFTAVAETDGEKNLWVPSIWTPIDAEEPCPGAGWKVSAGGVVDMASQNTLVLTPYWGRSATPSSNLSLGASPAVGTATGGQGLAWFLEFTIIFRALGVGASSGAAVGSGFYLTRRPTAPIVFGGTVVTTADTTTGQGLVVSATWSGTGVTFAASITCQWVQIRSLN